MVSFSAFSVDHPKALGLPTPWATEALVPTSKPNGCEALLLRPIGLDEFGEGKALLALDSALGNTKPSSRASVPIFSRIGGSRGLAEFCF